MLVPVADFSTITQIKRIGRLRIHTRGPELLGGLRCPIQTSRSVHLSCQVDLRNVAVKCVSSQLGRHVTSRPLSTSRICGQIRAISSSVSTDSGSATPSSELDGPPSATAGVVGDVAAGTTLTVSVISAMDLIGPQEWDDVAGPTGNPFLSHAFLNALEQSGSACQSEGWLPQHLVARDGGGAVVGVAPLYLKGHSYGEYVFDHSWASAYSRMGRSYYPKLQCCVPFTPATGPRILVKEGPLGGAVFDSICEAMKKLAHQYKVSSLHITFPTRGDWEGAANHGFLKRMGMQYHWINRDYNKFDDFLMDLKQGKRKNIRQERKKAKHWDAFYTFYRSTTDNKWGQAYLTRDFFHLLGETLSQKVLLVMAEHDNRLVAGALNLIGSDTLYGRNWGCQPGSYYPNLHFEACYYQAMEAAIEWKLKKVEAGAQGEHKIQRGYLPTPTYSAHYMCSAEFGGAVEDFLRRESMQVKMTLAVLDEGANPFKEGIVTPGGE